MLHDPEVQRAVDTFQLGLPRVPVAGRAGELLGRGSGSSLEFQEFRPYVPGDDIRHVDWAAFARSDTMMVRLYREEISPRTEILVDVSRSMRSGESFKPLLTKQLAAMFGLLSARVGGQPSMVPLTDQIPLQRHGLEGLDLIYNSPFSARSTLAELLEQNLVPLKTQAVRIVISDFLFPHNPETLIRRLATGASVLWVVQLLTQWEAHPSPLGGRRIIDIETGAESDLILDQRAITGYLQRLGFLQAELLRHCSRAHAPFVTLVAEHGLDALCRGPLSAAGLLRAA